MSFSLHLLGSLEVQAGEQGATLTLSRKTGALLAYLAATRRPHRRQALADMFCQGANDPAGALRWHLSRLRRTLSADAIQTDGDRVRFEPDAGTLDLDQFEGVLEGDLSAWDDATLADSVGLYRGEFLAGLALRHAAEFELWLVAQRARLRALYERGLAELVERCIAGGRHAEAMEYAQQLLHSDPLHEEAHARLIWLYATGGRRDAALQQFELCRDLLHSELGVEPLPETQALYDQILAGQLTADPSTEFTLSAAEVLRTGRRPLTTSQLRETRRLSSIVHRPTADFVGREAELAQLATAWEAATGGQGAVVLVEAEAGGGKTRLVQEFAATALDGLFLSGRCYESERALPYRPWIDLLEAYVAGLDDTTLGRLSPFWLDHLIRLLPGLVERLDQGLPATPPTTGGEVEHLFTAVAELLLQLSEIPPRLIFVDDLQWADEMSLQLFHFLARRVRRAPVLLVGAFRSEEVRDNPGLQTLISDLRRNSLLHLRPAPLTLASITSLTEQLWPMLPEGYRPHVCAMLTDATGGNPLFVTEVLRELAHTTEVPTALPVPPSVRDLIRRRLRGLPESSRQVIEALAVLDAPALPEQAQQVSGRSEEETVMAIDLGLRRGLLEPRAEAQPTHYDFGHDLVRQAVVGQLSDIRRRLLHRRAATVLERAGARAATLAYHWGMAGDGAQEGHYAALAGEEAAAVYANDEAIYYLQRALERLTEPERRIQVMQKLGEVWMLIGQWAEAEDIHRQVLALAERVGRPRIQAQSQVALSKLMRQQGAYAEALSRLEQARAIYEALDDPRGRGQASGGLGAVYWSLLDYPRALSCFEEQLRLATASGDQQLASMALGSLGVVYTEMGEYAPALACYHQELEIASQLDDRLRVGKVIGNMGTVYLDQGDYPRALACYAHQLQVATELGDRFMTAVAVGNMIGLHTAQGDYPAAERLSRQAIALGRALNIPLYLCEYLHNSADLCARQQRYAAAQSLNEEALHMATQIERTDIQFRAAVLSVRLRVRLHQIDVPTAIKEVETLLSEWPADPEQAAVQYEIWRLDPTQASCRRNAAGLYRNLYARIPNIEYRQRYTALTGDTLPDPPPLPALPASVTQGPPDLEALLVQVDQMIAEPGDSADPVGSSSTR